MNAVLATFALWLLAAMPAAAMPEICGIPSSLVETFAPLPHVSAAMKHDKKLAIVVLSAASSQAGPASTLKTYPASLEASLREQLKGITVDVFAYSVPKKTVDGFVPILPKLLNERKPNLVIWQTGTYEAMRGIDPDVYGDKLQLAVTEILMAKTDVILINPQFGPHTSLLFDVGPYVDNIRWVAQTKNVPTFNRYEIMKYWGENGIFDLSAIRSDGTYEKLHKCLGELLSDFVIRAAALSAGQER